MDTPRLALVELHERDGRIGRVVDVWRWPLTLGRAMDNDVVIDDPHVAPHHATLALADDGQLHLQPQTSLSGVRVNGKRAAGDMPLVSILMWQKDAMPMHPEDLVAGMLVQVRSM